MVVDFCIWNFTENTEETLPVFPQKVKKKKLSVKLLSFRRASLASLELSMMGSRGCYMPLLYSSVSGLFYPRLE